METEEAILKTKRLLNSKWAEWSLAAISFIESSFFPIIVDPFLVAMTLAKKGCWIRYSVIVTVTSVVGGLFGYVLGAIFFDLFAVKMIELYRLQHVFEITVASVDSNAFYFTLIGAFTPIPYKIIALVGGFLKINIFTFILASIIGRSARFFLVAYITKQFGEQALRIFSKRFSIITAGILIGIALYIVFTVIK